MITAAARPLVLAAYSDRLRKLNLPGNPVPLSQARDPEETLRQLMVLHGPRMRQPEGITPRWDQDAAELLLTLGESAAGEDLRYLDAFHNLFEMTESAMSGLVDDSWLPFLRVYAYLLGLHIDRLRKPPHQEPRTEPTLPGWSAEDDQTMAVWRKATPPFTIVILAENLNAAWRVYRGLQPLPEIAIHILLANNQGDGWWRFLLRQGKGICRKPRLFPLLLRGSVHFRMAPLHHPDVIQWLRSKGFWVGLHAMSVIYKRPALTAFRVGLLNAHIGILPAFRGRSVVEWSLLAGRPTGVTVFVMDEGIDTGRYILWRQEVGLTPASDVDQAKSRLFGLDGSMYRSAVRRLLSEPGVRLELNDGPGRRYYVMSRLLVGVVNQLLQRQ